MRVTGSKRATGNLNSPSTALHAKDTHHPSTLNPPSSESMTSGLSPPTLPNLRSALMSTSAPLLQSATFSVVVFISSGSVNLISFRRRSSSDGLLCDGVPGRNGAPRLPRYVGGDWPLAIAAAAAAAAAPRCGNASAIGDSPCASCELA